jgi:hypothetical protein
VLAIPKIVAALKSTRAEFDTMFLQAQIKAGVTALERKGFEAIVDPSLADRDAFAVALQFAQAHQWLEILVDIIVDEGLEDGSITRELAEQAVSGGNAALQAMTNLASGFDQPDVIYRGIGDGMRWTGKILVDNQFRGTGILISPNLVLTAWHVVEPMFSPDPQGNLKPLPNAATRLQVEFDDFLAQMGRTLRPMTPLRVNAHQDWCIVFSPCHPDELGDGLPAQLSDLKGYWDYAIIRLDKAAGLMRRWAPLDARSVVPRPDESIVLFQHPAAQPLKVTQNFIASINPPAPSAVPKLRFLHYANAVHGSSGGPCFDKSFMLFGFHQGQWKTAPTSATNNERITNRGVPVVRVLEHIKQEITELPTLDPAENPFWSLGATKQYAPVLGTDDFQKVVWRSAVAGTPKVIVITGVKGSGKSFRVEVLSSMLSDGGHLKVTLKADSISKLSAPKLAELICLNAGVAAPPLTPLSEVDSTTSVWLKDEVVAKVMSALDAARNGRLVWFSITDLNKFEFEHEDASQLLLLLYEQTLAVEWLRVVLDGMQGDVQESLTDQKESYRATEILRGDIESYFKRFIAELDLPVGQLVVDAMSKLAFDDYQTNLTANPVTAMKNLYEDVRKTARAFLAQVNI